ncbi:MAG: right-handed parallel beta-helix repeat-containing protein, partial [Verrucomicrobia bacterium]|nr:right-handed parallel beta-helix repeat-containing protein [Verrucomicrobiota bacterium]
MKTLIHILTAASTLALLHAQGPLTPPGVPAPMMKTLAQVEARTPLPPLGFNPATDFPITISQAGSYYLTQNVTGVSGKHGIVISSGNVTLDLNGFTLQGSGADAGLMDGISGSSISNVVVRNGRIRSWAGRGVYLGTVAVVEDLNIENCGLDGIKLGEQAAVRRCRIGACALAPNSGYAITVQHLSMVENCNAVGNSSGILVTYGCTVRDCSVTYSGRWGIRCGYENVIKSNLCDNNGTAATDGAGIYATDANNRIEDNKLLNADLGLYLGATGNYVANNVVKNNTKNYNIAPILGKANQLNILLCQIPETIEWPCSVRLAGSLYLDAATSNGITVAANDVTIDMGGHTLTGPGTNSGSGIYQG